MPYQRSETIGAIDDISAALSAIRESVLILAVRRRDELTEADAGELQRILDAADRIQEYHLLFRAGLSRQYQEATRQSTAPR